MKPDELVAAIAAAREKFAQVEQARPQWGAGLGAMNQHNQHLTAAAAHLAQMELAYRQTFGVVPGELEKLRAGG